MYKLVAFVVFVLFPYFANRIGRQALVNMTEPSGGVNTRAGVDLDGLMMRWDSGNPSQKSATFNPSARAALACC